MNRTAFFALTLLTVFSASVAQAEGKSGERWWGTSLFINVPHAVNLSGEYRTNERWSFAFSLGGLPTMKLPVQKEGVDISAGVKNVDLRARWHPFSGAFFFGAALGWQSVHASGDQTFTAEGVDVPTTLEVNFTGPYLTPHMGWLWTWSNGLLLGFELGVQVPLSPSTSMNVSTSNPLYAPLLELVKLTPDYLEFQKNIEDAGDVLGKWPLPYVAVLRIGMTF